MQSPLLEIGVVMTLFCCCVFFSVGNNDDDDNVVVVIPSTTCFFRSLMHRFTVSSPIFAICSKTESAPLLLKSGFPCSITGCTAL